MREEIYDFEKGKVHKLELYVFDPNNTYDDAMSIFNEIYNKLYDGVPAVFNSETTEVYWYDDIGINLSSATRYDFEKYFEE